MSSDAEDDVVVPGRVETVRAPLQLRHALQPDDDLRRGRRQRLAGAHEDRDAGPAPVLDLEPSATNVSVSEPGSTPSMSR